jgi:hypothetical protein
VNKRYQVFISSTFSDLQEERREVIETLMQMDCIPAGMELFPASNDEQFEFIKKVIDDCDYYVLIIGGRYGSISYEGISYTEKEYDYALSKNIPVLSFIHGNPDNIPSGKTEKDEVNRIKLEKFKEKVSSNRLIKYWTDKKELPGAVALSLLNAIKVHPQLGWVRGGNFDNNELLVQLNMLRMKNEKLNNKINTLEAEISIKQIEDLELSSGTEKIGIYGFNEKDYNGYRARWDYNISWDMLFSLWGPYLFEPKTYEVAKSNLENAIALHIGKGQYPYFDIDDNLIQIIKVQFLALGMIEISTVETVKDRISEFIKISGKGKTYLIKIKSIKKQHML